MDIFSAQFYLSVDTDMVKNYLTVLMPIHRTFLIFPLNTFSLRKIKNIKADQPEIGYTHSIVLLNIDDFKLKSLCKYTVMSNFRVCVVMFSTLTIIHKFLQ